LNEFIERELQEYFVIQFTHREVENRFMRGRRQK